jgi:hypothetical protein
MVITLKYDVWLSDFEVVSEGSKVELIGEYKGFSLVKYGERQFYLNSDYLEIPALVSNL